LIELTHCGKKSQLFGFVFFPILYWQGFFHVCTVLSVSFFLSGHQGEFAEISFVLSLLLIWPNGWQEDLILRTFAANWL